MVRIENLIAGGGRSGKIRQIVALSALLILILLFPFTQIAQSQDMEVEALDLDGLWMTEDGELVRLTRQENSVIAEFLIPFPCPHGGERRTFISGQLQDNALTGELTACTNVEEFVTDCDRVRKAGKSAGIFSYSPNMVYF